MSFGSDDNVASMRMNSKGRSSVSSNGQLFQFLEFDKAKQDDCRVG